MQGVAGSNPVHPTLVTSNASKACKKSLIYKLFCFLPYQIVAKNIKCCANNKVNWNVNYLPVRKLNLTTLLSFDCESGDLILLTFHGFIFRVSCELDIEENFNNTKMIFYEKFKHFRCAFHSAHPGIKRQKPTLCKDHREQNKMRVVVEVLSAQKRLE